VIEYRHSLLLLLLFRKRTDYVQPVENTLQHAIWREENGQQPVANEMQSSHGGVQSTFNTPRLAETMPLSIMFAEQ
jgi:hypothetical protein